MKCTSTVIKYIKETTQVDMHCNVDKTVCMRFSPRSRRYVVTDDFRLLTVNNKCVKYVSLSQFKYFGHIITNDLCGVGDTKREIRNMFIHCNMLTCKFYRCSSLDVKLTSFRSLCLCFTIVLRGDTTRHGLI